jgi:nucleotide-binding universal stress UspA family protein
MRALIWITEHTWQACIDYAKAVLHEDADVTLLHVAPSDVEELLAGGPAGLLGRRRPPPPGPPPWAIAAEEAETLLEAARDRLGRPAQLLSRRGRIEREVLEACANTELLVLARDGEPRPGPASIGPRTRFVLDHATCQVLLVWRLREGPERNFRRRHPVDVHG